MAALPERALRALDRAKSYLAANDPARAIADLETVIGKAPKSAEAWWVMAKARNALGDFAQAEQCFRRAAVLMPKSYDIWFGLGLLLATQERYEEAATVYERALDVAGKLETNAIHNLGSCYLKLGRYEEAAKIFKVLAATFKDNSDFWALLGMCHQGSADYQEALDAYREAITRGAGGYTLNLSAGACAYKLNDLVSAARYARAALEASPGDEVATRHLEMAQQGPAADGKAVTSPA
jgi:Tfp pilus assembly protein PilF